MTTAAVKSSAALSIPPSQNTAPVHEYRCLYTHDVRRKQKRWQDGRVKFHNFNKRLMVYDDTQNFIGDTHWKEDGDLGTDEEVMLDVGVLVQIGDLLNTTQTDLAPLFGKERRKPQENKTLQGRRTPARAAHNGVSAAIRSGNGTAQKHRSLNALLGATIGGYGRAMFPIQSPFGARKANKENEREDIREAKRKTTAEAWTVAEIATPFWTRRADERSKTLNSLAAGLSNPRPGSGRQSSLTSRQLVDITWESDNVLLSDATMPSSPKPPATAARVAGHIAKPMRAAVRSPKPKPPHAALIRSSSPSVSTRTRICHVEIEQEADRGDTLIETNAPEKTPTVAKKKHLRIGRSQQRPTLLCQKVAPAENTRPKEKPAKKRRRNLYQTLSDLENGNDTDEIIPPHKKKKMAPTPTLHNGSADLTKEPSGSSPAFDTGLSSSPKRMNAHTWGVSTTETRARERGVAQRKQDREMLGTVYKPVAVTKAQSKASKPPARVLIPTKQQSFQRIRSENDIEQDDRKNGAIAFVDKAELNEPINERKLPLANQAPTKSTKKPLRRVLSEAAATESTSSTTKRTKAKNAKEKQAQAQASLTKKEQGPWTTEAMDLFDWRPPDWEERMKRIAESNVTL